VTGFSPEGLKAIRDWLRGYVDGGKLPGALVLVARHGEIALLETVGSRWAEAGEPLEPDTIFRLHSMTKPVTAVAALILADEGELAPDDPVSRFIESFGSLTVNRLGGGEDIDAVSAERAMTVHHLLTHTSGLTYGEGNPGAVSRLYEERRTDFGPDDGPLAEIVDRLAEIPLLCQPGTSWCYGVSTDVLGRVIEVASGVPLDHFLHERILEPLGMTDTSFRVPAEKLERFAALYEATSEGGLRLLETPASSPLAGEVTTLSGGAGLISTAGDYFRFAEMLRRGGTLDGVHVLAEETVRLMTSDRLGRDLAAMGQATFNETAMDGVGFGLGVSVVLDPSRTAWRSAWGEFAWGGYASTAFWVDPEHEVTVVFLTQVIPSDRYPIRGELRALVADALES
jgi:CubicO group peptidase (beta-lactamase class C family)